MDNNININMDNNTNTKRDIALEIQTIFDNNKINDLNRFLSKRQCLNTTNTYFVYLFHLVQSAGILTTSIAAGTNNTELVWIGVGLNVFATLINIYEKTNNSILSKLFNNIKLIKENNLDTVPKPAQFGVRYETDGKYFEELNWN